MKRTAGRPRVDDDDESVDVHLTLPARQYEATYAQAQRARETVQDVIRRAIKAHAPTGNRNPKSTT